MKRQGKTNNKCIRIGLFSLLLFVLTNMSCSQFGAQERNDSEKDTIIEDTIGDIVVGNDTIEITKSLFYFNRSISPRCSSRLWIVVNGIIKGHYYVGGDDYDFFLRKDTLVCITKDSGVETTIDLSNGIPPQIFIVSSFDKDSTAMGDFYTFESEE